MATLVMAGSIFSPISVNDAAAACTAPTLEGQVVCSGPSTVGETVTSSSTLDIYVSWDGVDGPLQFDDYEISDGFLVAQTGNGAPVSIAIIGENMSEEALEFLDSPVIDMLAADAIPVTISNDGAVDDPDNEGSKFHALEITAINGDINLAAFGDVTFETTEAGRDGININTRGGDALVLTSADFYVEEDGIDIVTRGGDAFVGYFGKDDDDSDLYAEGDGIKINSAGGDAFVYIGEGADVYAGGDGVSVAAGNGIAGVWIDEDVDAEKSAIRASGAEVFVIIGESGDLAGSGSNPANAVVNLNGRDRNVFVNLGDIHSNDDGTAAQSNDMALEIARGAASIYNFGTLTGRIDATNNNDVFVNGGRWQFTGQAKFGADVDDGDEFLGEDEDGDVLRNVLYETEDGFEFGVIENAFNEEVSETAQYLDLEKFYNGGVISLQDQYFGERLYRDRAYTDGDFIGEGGLIAIDAELSGFNPDADRFIIGGNVSGTTFVDVNIIGLGPVVFDARGIPVIEIAGDVDPGTSFQLNGGPIDAGLFSYDLHYTTDLDGRFQDDNIDDRWSLATNGLAGGAPIIDSMWVLAATMDAEAYQMPVLAYAAGNLWHATAGVWGDRTSDLRTGFAGTGFGGGGADMAAPTAANTGPGFWGRAFGGTVSRDFDNSFSTPGGTETYSDSFRQNYYGVVGGLDFEQENVGQNSAWLFGILGGFTGSDVDFDLSSGEADYQQVSLGAYATYLNGGFFADAMFKADFGNMDFRSAGLADNVDASYTTIGVVADVGYRFGLATGWFIEPKATLAYISTDFDSMDVLGTGVEFDDGNSLRGRLGARAGTTIDNGGSLITPYVEASVWNEFDGDYTAAFTGIGATPTVSYDVGGTYGEVAAGADFMNVGSGWSAYAKGSVQFGEDDMLGLGGNLGFRKTW